MILKSFYVGAIVLTCTAAPALAAGAIAVGECDRAGWSRNYETESGARQRALSECRANGDRTCVIRVEVPDNACGAFAVSGSCGARGWAYAQSERRAVELALQACRDYGGTNCRVTIRFCDER